MKMLIELYDLDQLMEIVGWWDKAFVLSLQFIICTISK